MPEKRRRIQRPVIRLKRGAGDEMIPPEFIDIITRRYLPVLSLTYVASVIGLAARAHNGEYAFLHFLLHSSEPYTWALLIALWASGPAIIWIFLKAHFAFCHKADLWYKIIAGLMSGTVLLSFFLFPAGTVGGSLRLFMVATIPVFGVQYILFVRGGLPNTAAWPLTVAGLGFFAYGLALWSLSGPFLP